MKRGAKKRTSASQRRRRLSLRGTSKNTLAETLSQGASRARELWCGWACRRSGSTSLAENPAWKWPDPDEIQQHPSQLSLGLTLEAINDLLGAVGWLREYERTDTAPASLPPGDSGFELAWDSGRITGLTPGSPPELSRLMTGWTLQSIEEWSDNKELLRTSMDGSEPFDATFHALGHWITEEFGPRRVGEECGYDQVNHIRDEFRLLTYEHYSVAGVMPATRHPGAR